MKLALFTAGFAAGMLVSTWLRLARLWAAGESDAARFEAAPPIEHCSLHPEP